MFFAVLYGLFMVGSAMVNCWMIFTLLLPTLLYNNCAVRAQYEELLIHQRNLYPMTSKQMMFQAKLNQNVKQCISCQTIQSIVILQARDRIKACVAELEDTYRSVTGIC